MTLAELASRGPRAARTIWSRLPGRIRDAYGAQTIADVLARRNG